MINLISMYKFLLNVLLLLVLFQLPLSAQQRMIFLFDNSGSMTGYYLQPESNFKIFCNALIKNTVSQVDNVEVMLFSKTEKDRGLISPTVIYDGSADQINFDELQMKMVLQKGNDGYLGNTDLIEALNDGITELDGNAGIIWMITDNINDVSGTGDDSYENTLEFYNLLRRDENIRKILMYPIPEKVTRNEKVSEGYVIYGLVYSSTPISQPLLEDYDKMLRASGIRQKAITLKPLDQGTIILKPLKTQGKVTSGKLYFDGKTLRGFGFNEGEQIKEVFNDLVLKSNLYPYIIESASLKVGLDDFTSSDYSVESLGTQTITPSTVSNVSPEGEVKGFSVIFNMPEITPVFSFNTIFKEDFTVGGNLILEVYNTDIKLDDSYIQNFKQLFALSSVPEIFQPVIKDKTIYTAIPLEIKIRYGVWRLYVLIGIIALVIIVLSLIVFLLLKRKCFILEVEQLQNSVCLNLINSYTVYSGDSTELGKLKKTFSGQIAFIQSKNTNFAGRKILLNFDLPYEIESQSLDGEVKKVNILISGSKSTTESEYQNSSTDLY